MCLVAVQPVEDTLCYQHACMRHAGLMLLLAGQQHAAQDTIATNRQGYENYCGALATAECAACPEMHAHHSKLAERGSRQIMQIVGLFWSAAQHIPSIHRIAHKQIASSTLMHPLPAMFCSKLWLMHMALQLWKPRSSDSSNQLPPTWKLAVSLMVSLISIKSPSGTRAALATARAASSSATTTAARISKLLMIGSWSRLFFMCSQASTTNRGQLLLCNCL